MLQGWARKGGNDSWGWGTMADTSGFSCRRNAGPIHCLLPKALTYLPGSRLAALEGWLRGEF